MSPHPDARAVRDALENAGAVDASGEAGRVHLLPDAVHTAGAPTDVA